MKSPTKLRMLCPPGSDLRLPSLVLVWLSNTGSITFTLTAATMPVRTSPASQSFLKKSLHLGHRLAEGALVRAALRGVLAVHEAVVLLAVVVGVGHRHLDVVPRRWMMG
jgi:chorismate-pyruvate lyase